MQVPDQLVTPPSPEFYDPERPAELRQVDRNAYAAYKQMIEAAIADPTLKLAHQGRRADAHGEIFQDCFFFSLA